MLPKYPHVAARIFNTPLLIHPGKLDAIIAGLSTRLGLSAQVVPVMYDSLLGERRKPGYRLHGNVAVIDVFGILSHRGSFDMSDSSYLLGYQDVARMLDVAVRDRDVDGIVLNIDSPGGEVHGAFQLAEQIRRAAAVKPVRAVIDGVGASAAYLLGSAARDVTATTTAQVGSIGVVMKHMDASKALAQEGVAYTLVYAGAHKVDGNPFEALPASVRAEMQNTVNSIYDQFVSAVATHRNLDAAKVRGTEAQTYLAADALKVGLVNQIGTLDQVVASMITATGGRSRVALQTQTEATQMSGTEKYFTKEEVEKARAEGRAEGEANLQAKVEAARAEERAAGETKLRAQVEATRAEERARVNAIMSHPEAVGRTALAIKAVDTGLTADQAGVLMAAAPKEKASAPGLAIAGNPAIAPDGGVDASAQDERTAAAAAVQLIGRGAKKT